MIFRIINIDENIIMQKAFETLKNYSTVPVFPKGENRDRSVGKTLSKIPSALP